MAAKGSLDRYGRPISTSSQRSLEHYDAGVERVLSYGVRPSAAFEASFPERLRIFAIAASGLVPNSATGVIVIP